MKQLALVRKLSFPALFAAAAIMIGCSKKADQPAAAAAPESAPAPAAEAAPAADAAAQAAQPVQAPPPAGLDVSQMTGNPKTAMAEADAAVRQRQYEKAAAIMMAIQQAQLDAQQAAAARQQMVNFQRTLVNAIDSGDPNAKAAAAVLAGGHHH